MTICEDINKVRVVPEVRFSLGENISKARDSRVSGLPWAETTSSFPSAIVHGAVPIDKSMHLVCIQGSF